MRASKEPTPACYEPSFSLLAEEDDHAGLMIPAARGDGTARLDEQLN